VRDRENECVCVFSFLFCANEIMRLGGREEFHLVLPPNDAVLELFWMFIIYLINIKYLIYIYLIIYK
jgi:hypothetical protein